MATVLLKGSYTERLFEVHELDLERGTASVSQKQERIFNAGDTNSVMSDTPHQVINHSDAESVISLFVRGKSEPRSHLNFDLETGEVYVNNRSKEHLKADMLATANFNSFTM